MTTRDIGQDHRLADRQPSHTGTNRLDVTRTFMAEHNRVGRWPVGLAHRQIGVAHPGSHELHPNLASAGLFYLDLLQSEDSVGLVQNCSCRFHLSVLSWR